ncbi:hypothetical protein [Jeotgalibacillus soli]|uniref:Uncharacterized protein n=1 Tax=Jeotgalibacillus soli TaxID=889306 RepID=A0A0C2VDP2_9BACL|nr:hypothetical protein [Jeotgalibacillus soli]KIL42681.1 hypothetical protein KP78_39040 [Jeotgalibacillus soli]
MHTADFKGAIASIYGDEGAAAFEKVWTENHIEAEGVLVAAVVAQDEEEIAAAKEQFNTFAMDIGAFIGSANELFLFR